jgi:hypothetical protein
MFWNDEEKYTVLKAGEQNALEGKEKFHIYILPPLVKKGDVVELYLMAGSAIVESEYAPIRSGRYCGTRVCVGMKACKYIDYVPKFIWNGREWLLQTFGNFIFLEIEINGEE